MKSDLVRIHHAEYLTDIPFWINKTEGYDTVLEVGCGHGRVTLPLAASGRAIVGVDKDSGSISFLKDQLKELDNDVQGRISVIQTDILEYNPDTTFGGVIIPCNTYSTFNAMERSKLIGRILTYLRRDGIFIASIPNPTQTEEVLAELRESDGGELLDLEGMFTHPDTGFPVQVSSRLRAGDGSLLWGWIYDHLQPDGEVERVEVTTEHYPRSEKEFVQELLDGGFREVQSQGDFSGEGYSETSPYLILLCKK